MSREQAQVATPPSVAEPRAVESIADAGRSAESGFSKSITISAVRCLLTYIVFPFVAPLVGLSDSIGPGVGLAIGLFAIAANVFSIRRFFKAQHRYRYYVTVLHLCVITLLVVLIVEDLRDLFN